MSSDEDSSKQDDYSCRSGFNDYGKNMSKLLKVPDHNKSGEDNHFGEFYSRFYK